MIAAAFDALPFSQKVPVCQRVESIESSNALIDPLYEHVWERVNNHLGTNATTLRTLVKELGVARFGQTPVVGDPFCGGGSIPFEAARIGCSVVASDLNPVAAMLTWGGLNIIGASSERRAELALEQAAIASAITKEIDALGFEQNARGEKIKALLYCLEAIDPQTGWLVPVCPTWVVSRKARCIGRLVPDYSRRRFDIAIESVSPIWICCCRNRHSSTRLFGLQTRTR